MSEMREMCCFCYRRQAFQLEEATKRLAEEQDQLTRKQNREQETKVR
jgi:hypothetical protein